MCIICRGEYKGETELDCSGCTPLTSLPELPNMTNLDCRGCTSLPPLPNVTHLYCWGCTSLTSLPAMPNLTTLYSGSCAWLNHSSNSEYTINITRLTHLQRWYRRMVWCRYLSSKEFIEWCYHPDNIGGKQAKKNLMILCDKQGVYM